MILGVLLLSSLDSRARLFNANPPFSVLSADSAWLCAAQTGGFRTWWASPRKSGKSLQLCALFAEG